jgi:uncharacterized membrane protein
MNNVSYSTKNKLTTKELVGTAILITVVFILQYISGFIKIGPFNITLTLIPIIVGGIVFGPLSGAILGFVFGAIVTKNVLIGADAGGLILLQYNAVATILICLLKSTCAGYLSGVVAHRFGKKDLRIGVLLAAITAPIVNTGLFVIGLFVFFMEILKQWAGASQSVALYVITGLVGINFLIELLTNLILVPVALRVVRAAKLTQNLNEKNED